jgi:hypothetical protein
MAELRYHEAILRHLGIAPVVSPQRQARIAERERICGVRFPAAVTEWMSIEGIEALFFKNTNNDYLPSLRNRADEFGRPEHTEQGYLCVAYENQAVILWYIPLDEGDDPPVYHDDGATVGVPFESSNLAKFECPTRSVASSLIWSSRREANGHAPVMT